MLVLAVLAGCSGSGPADATTTSPTPDVTVSTGPAESGEATTATAGPVGEDVVDFSELNDDQQAAFLGALDGDRVEFVPNTRYIDGYDDGNLPVFRNHEYVRHEGELYRIELSNGYPLHKRTTYRVRRSEPTPNASVVAFGNLSPTAREPFREGVRTGEVTFTYGQSDLLAAFDGEYVRYENETYLVELRRIADAGTWILEVEPYREDDTDGG